MNNNFLDFKIPENYGKGIIIIGKVIHLGRF